MNKIARKKIYRYSSFCITSQNVVWIVLVSIILLMLCKPSFVDGAFPFGLPNLHQNNDIDKLGDRQSRLEVDIGPCKWIFDKKCPDPDIKYYLYTRKNRNDRQNIHVDETWAQSNLSDSFFDPKHPVKIILHGYNSDMFLTPLIQMKDEYFDRGNYNLFFVDWSELARAPCYPSAAHNTKHAGQCIGQLVNRVRDGGTENIHIIGFSLGAHVAAFAANQAKDFQVPRITGLDPALPLFITASKNDKLDESDAAFVDIIHSNAFVQGQVERCGSVDFYMNGGIMQPGCLSFNLNPFACSHHRSVEFFTESIKSERGFWGWECSSYYSYMFGLCPRSDSLHLAGEDCRTNSKGMFLVMTNSEPPFASGQWDVKPASKYMPNSRRDPFIEKIDEYGKLDSAFNYMNIYRRSAIASHAATTATASMHDQLSHLNLINENEYPATDDKSRFEMNDDAKLGTSSTERWRQNDKFILVENPLTTALNRTMIHHQTASGSSDEFQFPKVTYR